jgi:hypothetical protein
MRTRQRPRHRHRCWADSIEYRSRGGTSEQHLLPTHRERAKRRAADTDNLSWLGSYRDGRERIPSSWTELPVEAELVWEMD